MPQTDHTQPETKRVGRSGFEITTAISHRFWDLFKGSRRVNGIALLVLALLVGLGSLAHYHIDTTLKKMVKESVTVMLNAEEKALREWIRGEKEMLLSWTHQPVFRRNISLLDSSSPHMSPSARLNLFKDINEMLDKAVEAAHYRNFLVVRHDGIIDISQNDSLVGKKLNKKGMELATRAFQGETFITLPLFPSEYLDVGEIPADNPVLILGTAIQDMNNNRVAVLMVSIPAEDDFSGLFSMLHFGNGGDSFAFNSQGILLSESRWTDQLAELGLFHDNSRHSSILNITLVAPGANLTKKTRKISRADNLPLTLMAQKALAGNSGLNLEGYSDHRGVKVIGAWRWIDDLDMGISIELEQKEAFRILLPLRLAQFGLLILLAISTVAFLFSSYVIQFLKGKVEEVRQLGQYRLGDKIGEGGMGSVYLAQHAMLQRPTAIKLLKKDTAIVDAVTRFEQEVQLTCRLSHPNTVEIYDYGRTADDQFYYAMEYVGGYNLADLLEKEGHLPTARAIYILKQICGSLAEAHGLNLIHRDIKPPNIMVSIQGGIYDQVKVLDFGLVKDIAAVNPDLDVTQVLQGTPTYIAPERINNPALADERTDIYSLGTIAFNMLSGEDVFSGGSAMQVCVKVLQEEPKSLLTYKNLEVPESLAALVHQCLAKDPDDRPQTVKEIITRLDEIESSMPQVWTQEQAEKWWKSQDDTV